MASHFELLTAIFLVQISTFELLTLVRFSTFEVLTCRVHFYFFTFALLTGISLRVTSWKVKILFFHFRATNLKLKNKKIIFEVTNSKVKLLLFHFRVTNLKLKDKAFDLESLCNLMVKPFLYHFRVSNSNSNNTKLHFELLARKVLRKEKPWSRNIATQEIFIEVNNTKSRIIRFIFW